MRYTGGEGCGTAFRDAATSAPPKTRNARRFIQSPSSLATGDSAARNERRVDVAAARRSTRASPATLGANDLLRAAGFYNTLLAEVGAKRLWDFGRGIAWGVAQDKPSLGITKPYEGNPATVRNRVEVALIVDSREKVDRVHFLPWQSSRLRPPAPPPSWDRVLSRTHARKRRSARQRN